MSRYNWHKIIPAFGTSLSKCPHDQPYFAGGESLIIDEHYDLLEECTPNVSAKNIELRYNSNAVEWRDDLFDLWAQFKRVRFHYSIDAYGRQNDYIRYPNKLKHQEDVFWKLDNTAPVEVTTATTIMALNIGYIPNLSNGKYNRDLKKLTMVLGGGGGGGGPTLHFVYWSSIKCKNTS